MKQIANQQISIAGSDFLVGRKGKIYIQYRRIKRGLRIIYKDIKKSFEKNGTFFVNNDF